MERPPRDCRPLSFASRDEAMCWCEAERLNVVAAVQQALEYGQYAVAWRLPAAVGEFLHVNRYFSDLVELHLTGLAAAKSAHDLCGESWIRTNLGIAYVDLEQYEAAVGHLSKAVIILHQLVTSPRNGRTATHVLGVARSTLGMALMGLEDHASAIEAFNEALAIQKATANRWGEARTLASLGAAYAVTGQKNLASRNLKESLRLHQETGNRWGEGVVLEQLAKIYQGENLLDESLLYYEKAVAIYRELNNRWNEAHALLGLCEVLELASPGVDITAYLRAALAIFDELDDSAAANVRRRLASSVRRQRLRASIGRWALASRLLAGKYSEIL